MSSMWTYLADITAYDEDAAVVRTLRYSTGAGFVTAGTDTPAHTLYEPVIAQAIDVTRTAFAPGTTQGQSKMGFGDLVLINLDGALDPLMRYALDGRAIRIRRALSTATSLSAFSDVFVGTMEQAEFSGTHVTIKLRDRQAALARSLQSTRYAGDNALPAGVEGGADLAGKPKPLAFGIVRNVSPACVNTARLIYQIHDGALASVDGVYDRGVALAFDMDHPNTADLLNDVYAPAPGAYATCLAEGLIRLGGSPVGTITADATEGAMAVDRAAAAIFTAILARMGIDPGDIAPADLVALDDAQPAELGFWFGEDVRATDALDQLAGTVGAWWGVGADGAYRIERVERPTDDAIVMTFDANDLLATPERLSTADAERGLPASRVAVRYARNYTVQDDLAGGVDDDRRADLAQGWREAVAEDPSVALVHLLATTLTVDTGFAHAADAEIEAARLLQLRSVQRHRFDVVVSFDAETATLDLGDTIGLIHDRFLLAREGEERGLPFLILGVEPDAANGTLRLSLWGNSFTSRNLIADTGAFLVTDDGTHLVSSAR